MRIHVMCQCESLEAFWICNWIGSGGSEDPLSLSLDLDLGFNIMRKWMASVPQIHKSGPVSMSAIRTSHTW